ncbi:MAG: hypothetical protein ABL902_01360 [Gallionella sp.]
MENLGLSKGVFDVVTALRWIFYLLDSRLRGNDEGRSFAALDLIWNEDE